MTWPLVLHTTTAVQDLGDPLYEIWTMRWVQHQLVSDPARLWDGNTGYPFSDSLLFSEPRISTAVIASPLQILFGNDVLSYNVMLIGSYVVLGIGMALLIWEITGIIGAGILSGFLAAFVPYRFAHLSHLNLLNYGWTPLALWLIARSFRRRSRRDAALAGVVLAVQVLASDTIALMAAFMAASAVAMLLWRERHRLTVGSATRVALVLGLPLLAGLPVALARIRVNRLYGFGRDLSTVEAMSATLRSYISVSPGNDFWHHTLPIAYPNPLFPGLIASIAALVGLLLAGRYWSSWVIYAGNVTLVGFVLSLGPFTTIGGRDYHLSYWYLYQLVPGFSSMRDAARFGMLALLGIEILAGLGLAAAWKRIAPVVPARWLTTVAPMLVCLILAGAAIELRNDVGIAAVPRDGETTAVYEWLATQPKGPVFELPANGLWANIGWTTQEIYFSTRHWNPITAAYTSFVPDRDVSMLVAIHGGTDTPSVASAANVGLLQDLGIRYVIIHRWKGYDWPLALNEASKLPELTRVGDFGDATVFTLDHGQRRAVTHRIQTAAVAVAGKPLVADLVTRNDNPTDAIDWLKLDPSATAIWRTMDGKKVAELRLPVHLGVTANPGLTVQPLAISAPPRAGTYRLTISCPGVAESVEQSVVVEPTLTASATPALFRLRSITLDKPSYRPGDWIEMIAVWEVRETPKTPLSATVQLLDANNQPLSQWDGQPLGEALPTTGWTAGSIVVEPLLVRLPAERADESLRAMIALYDERSPDLSRVMIEGPNGQSAPQFVSAPISIVATP